jgi:hypothetical protein
MRVVAAAVVALVACGGPKPGAERESRARDEFIRRLAEREGVADAWTLTSRTDVLFEDGFAVTQFYHPGAELDWFEVCGGCFPVRGVPVRWMNRRAHLRLRGTSDMHLVATGKVDTKAIFTRPRIELTIDGRTLASAVVGADGSFELDVTVPAALLDGWTDAYVMFTSVSEPWREPGDLRVAGLHRLLWEPIAR